MAYAVFGDSYVSRLETYMYKYGRVKQHVQFFGVPGMRTDRKFRPMFDRLTKAKPRVVVLNIGGNDINATCRPESIYEGIRSITEDLYASGVERVFVLSIAERGIFKGWTGLDKRTFDRIRRSINKRLKRCYGDNYVEVGKRLRYPRHYDSDLVHPGGNERGMLVYEHVVMNCFKKC